MQIKRIQQILIIGLPMIIISALSAISAGLLPILRILGFLELSAVQAKFVLIRAIRVQKLPQPYRQIIICAICAIGVRLETTSLCDKSAESA